MTKRLADSKIRKAIRGFFPNGRLPQGITVERWAAFAVDHAQRANVEGIGLHIDTLAFAIRRAEYSGRYNNALFTGQKVTDVMPYLVRMVSCVLAYQSVQQGHDAYVTFANLWLEHQKDMLAA